MISAIVIPIVAIIVSPFVGSFLAVVARRAGTGRSPLLGRSACDHCGTPLGPSELVPLISFALQGGRCRRCGAKIDPLHLLMECAALLVAVWAALVVPPAIVMPSCVLGWSLLTLAAIDWRIQRLPDLLTLPLVAVGLAATALLDQDAVLGHVIGAAAGYAAFAGIMLVYRRLRRRDGLGLGDAKLLAAAGAWLGWAALPTVLLLAALLGLAFVLAQRIRGEAIGTTSRVAFGPALSAAIWVVWLYGPLTWT